MSLKIYNSFSKALEDFKPLNADQVLMYTCGPTVYWYQHIGNFRTFTISDFVLRTLLFNGYNAKFVMNLTDVGHLTDDADQGDDKLESAAEREGKSAREIADFYIKDFYQEYDRLNLTHPAKFTRATDYISQQIDLVRTLETKGYTYKTSDGIYFDTSKFPSYKTLGQPTTDNADEGRRIEANSEKKNPSDFALWKYSAEGIKRWQEWPSPWGIGFPGWHLECSAMAIAELGETIDIHMGGEDHLPIHHPNEIAQSECATDKKFADYWLHVSHLQVDNAKMSKSLKNIFTVSDLITKGYNPLSLRYFYMTAHYRTSQNFTWGALQSAENALKKLYGVVEGYEYKDTAKPDSEFTHRFLAALNDDINLPKAIALMWEMLKSNLDEGIKLQTLLKMDEVLGLDIEEYVGLEIPQEVMDLAKIRDQYRKGGIWDKADFIRRQIDKKGYIVEDLPDGFKVRKKL